MVCIRGAKGTMYNIHVDGNPDPLGKGHLGGMQLVLSLLHIPLLAAALTILDGVVLLLLQCFCLGNIDVSVSRPGVRRAAAANRIRILFMYCPHIEGLHYETRKKTALDRRRTDRISLTHDLDLQCPASYTAMTYSLAKVQGQRLVGSKGKSVNKRTDRRTEAIALSPTLMRSVVTHTQYYSTKWHV